jgi:DNA-binding response OmpR family regulator/nitrogen-specific signal transduction histidine kinase
VQNKNSTSGKPNILIVDDDATIRLLMKDALTERAYNIVEFDNGVDVLHHLKQHQADLILLDVNMPGMSGFDVCSEILRLPDGTDISIVMVTALEDATSIARSYDLGATDFISKPINWNTFHYRIQYLIKARNAIVETKFHQLHLEYMEHVSRIITQNKTKDVIMQETMLAMLDIFSADRAFLIKPDTNNEGCFIIDCETASIHIKNINELATPVTDTMDANIFLQADNSEYPIVSQYTSSNPAPIFNNALKQQMLSALQLKHTENWYLIIQQNTTQANWTPPEEETFYKISLRITNMLSRYLLTEKLSRSDALLKQAQKIGHLGNWNWSPATRQLTWSDEIYQIYKYQRDNYTPDFNQYFEVVFEEDEIRLNQVKDILNNISSSYQTTHRIRTPDNSIRWVHEQCLGIYDKTGKLLEIDGIVQDITEQHNKKEQEVHSNKMDAIGQLTSGVAHDFGNFMTVARGNLELLSEKISIQHVIDHEDLELLEDAYSAINDSVELTKQLLAFSRKKSIAPVFINIKQTVYKFKTLFENTLGETIKLSINIDEKLSDIFVDPTQFESTLLNIIINARNAMPDGGAIELNAETSVAEFAEEAIQNEDNDLGDSYICIFVKDNGVGMSSDVLKHAIEPFYTTRTNQGTGLGLSMVYGFMKQSKGNLIIQSQPEKGTSVYLQFPIYNGIAENQLIKIVDNSLKDIHATILIVEDRHTLKQFVVRCLNNDGINILEAEDAATAQELLKSNKVDLLFTDIVMPGDLDGHELANWASHEYPDLKILLTTAMENENNKHSVRNYNFQLLPKPYSKSELTEKISSLLISQ